MRSGGRYVIKDGKPVLEEEPTTPSDAGAREADGTPIAPTPAEEAEAASPADVVGAGLRPAPTVPKRIVKKE